MIQVDAADIGEEIVFESWIADGIPRIAPMAGSFPDNNLLRSQAQASFCNLSDQPDIRIDRPAFMIFDKIGLQKNAFPLECKSVIGQDAGKFPMQILIQIRNAQDIHRIDLRAHPVLNRPKPIPPRLPNRYFNSCRRFTVSKLS